MRYTIQNEAELAVAFQYAKRLLSETQKINIEIQKQKMTRSIRQNRYYWGVVLKIVADELGYFPEEMHHCFATMFLKKIIKIGDREVETYNSTTRLKTDEFEDYLEKIRIFAAKELGIIIPLPNEVIDYDY